MLPKMLRLALYFSFSLFISATSSTWASQFTCSLEDGYTYNSLFNETALRVCSSSDGSRRPERVCIVGGGSSG